VSPAAGGAVRRGRPSAGAVRPAPPRAARSTRAGATARRRPGRRRRLDLAHNRAGNTVLAGFDEQKNKGLDIGGKAGDPVLAAADGRVVYAGAGLRGYGNLIILKHNNTYLTAYAHNQSLLVKEDQSVRKGQKIAEMGPATPTA
jgi:lipoprotein NlpD